MNDFSLLDSVGTPAFAVDIGNGGLPVRYWNRAIAALSGTRPDDALGRRLGWLIEDEAGAAARLTEGLEAGPFDALLAGLTEQEIVLIPVARVGARTFAIGTVRPKPVDAARDLGRERLLAMAAHDLRAPARNILVLTGVLRTTSAALDAVATDAVDRIERVAIRAQRLVGDLLTLADSAECRPVRPELVRFDAVAGEEAAALDPEARHRISAAQVSLVTDPILLGLLLRTLVGNAIRHGGERHMDIRIGAKRATSRGFVAVTVIDDGDGFSPDARALIERGAFRYGSGYGLLGLKRIAEALGGGLSLEQTAPGAGAVITATLPGRLLPRRAAEAQRFKAAS